MMFRLALILVLFLAPASMAQDPLAQGWSWSGIAAVTLERQSAPAPAPAPKPGDVCPTCQGTGKVGDGRISQTCLDCNGTGKVQATQVTEQQQRTASILAGDCPDGRCPLVPSAPAIPAPKAIQIPVMIETRDCPSGVCPVPTQRVQSYRPPPTTIRRGWIFRR
jgi:hypothetical protein